MKLGAIAPEVCENLGSRALGLEREWLSPSGWPFLFCRHEGPYINAQLPSRVRLGNFRSALVLWILSRNVTFDPSGRSFAIPGYMVWCALAYAGTASWLSWRVDRPLIQLNADWVVCLSIIVRLLFIQQPGNTHGIYRSTTIRIDATR
jgi:hypothetical protein